MLEGLREWLRGGIAPAERQREEAYATYHQAIGFLHALNQTLQWLDENEGAGDEPAPEDGKVTRIGS